MSAFAFAAGNASADAFSTRNMALGTLLLHGLRTIPATNRNLEGKTAIFSALFLEHRPQIAAVTNIDAQLSSPGARRALTDGC